LRLRSLPAIAVKSVMGWYRRDPDAAGRASSTFWTKGCG
jgi:hypothetical protein